MPLKPIKYGMKLYAPCESNSGYAFSLILYSSNRKESNVEMINKLANSFLNKNHHIYMDNFYSSTKLFEDLKEIKTFHFQSFKREGILTNNGKLNYLRLRTMSLFK